MSLNHVSARRPLRVRYGRAVAPCPAWVGHAVTFALLCAFALLGAPAFGAALAAALAAACAWLRASAGQAQTLARLRACEDEAARLRAEAHRNEARVQAEFALAQRQSADDVARVAQHCAQRVRRRIGEPARALVDLLDDAAQSADDDASVEAARDAMPVGLVHAALATLAQTATDTFDPSPADVRPVVLDEAPVDLRDVIDGAVVLLAPRAVARGLRLRVRIDRSVAEQVLADRVRVAQIVFDLLDYAIASTPTGQVTLTARAQTLNAASQRISIGVSGTRERVVAAGEAGVGGNSAAGSVACAFAESGTASGESNLTLASRTREAGAGGVANSTANIGASAFAESTTGAREPDLTLCRLLARAMGGALTVGDTGVFGVCAAFTAPFTVEHLARVPAPCERRHAIVELTDPDERQALVDLLDRLGVSVASSNVPAPPHSHMRITDRPAAAALHAAATQTAQVVAVRDAFIAGGVRIAGGLVELSINPLLWSALQRVCRPASSTDANGTAPAVAAATRRDADADTDANDEPRTVLVVDDNEINRRVVLRQLEVLGHVGVAAPNAADALAALNRQAFDLVITDLHMPGLSGIELAQRIRASLHPVPVVLMTGQTDIGDADAMPGGLFDALLPKPANLDVLQACVETLFAVRRSDMDAAQIDAVRTEPVDRSHLDALSARGIDVDDMLRNWQRTMHEDLALLHERIGHSDTDGVRASLHRLSGAVGLVGAQDLMAALRDASVMQRAPGMHLLDELAARVRTLIAQLDATAESAA
jgi:CheY-like chemotaxis protein